MRRIAIVGSRHRGWQEGIPAYLQVGSERDSTFISVMLQEFRKRYPSGFCILTLGCDAGFGRMIKLQCEEAKVGLMETIVQFNPHLPKSYFELLHLARHAALIDLGHEFHIFVTKHRTSNIEDLVGRLRILKSLPFFLYNEQHEVIETNQEQPQPAGS